MTIYLKTISLTALICCCLISICSAEEKPPAAPAPALNNAAAKNIFQPSSIDPALVRQSMQARSEYEGMNRKIIARTNKLYEENPEIKDLQAKMRELQKKINALLAEDKELIELKKKFKSIAPEIPAIPRKPPATPVSADKKK